MHLEDTISSRPECGEDAGVLEAELRVRGWLWMGEMWALVPEIPPIGFILTIVLLVKDEEKRWSINYEISFGGPI